MPQDFGRRPLVALNPASLTLQELRRLYDDGFSVPLRCNYCGDLLWEPHYGCDYKLKQEGRLAVAFIREAVPSCV